MSISERTPPRKARFGLPISGEIALLAAVACAFLLLPVLAGTLMLPSDSSLVTPQGLASVSSAD
jgi:hypothetical protein